MSHCTDNIEIAITDAMKNLDVAKEEISSLRSAQERLVSEQLQLESDVLELKQEKGNLEQAVKEMKANLQEQLRQSQNRAPESDDNSFDGDVMLFDSQETVFDTRACLVVDDQGMVPDTTNNSRDGSMSVCTASITSTSSKKRRRAKKVYNSPKKWRRMIRTHRLKSISIHNN